MLRSLSRCSYSRMLVSTPVRGFHTTNITHATGAKNKFITTELLKKSKGELVQTYYEAFKPVLIRITQEDGYTPFDTLNFIMGKPELREKIFRQASFRFGQEIPSSEKQQIATIKDLCKWYANKAHEQKQLPSYSIPSRISELIEQNEKKRQAEEVKKQTAEKVARSTSLPTKRHEQFFGPKYSVDEVRAAMKVLKQREGATVQQTSQQ